MTGDQLAATLGTGFWLTLVGSALLARRLPPATLVRLAAAWAAIIVGLVLILKLLSRFT